MHQNKQTDYGCGCNSICSNLWSREKKIRVLQKRLESIEDQKKEIETLIHELKDE